MIADGQGLQLNMESELWCRHGVPHNHMLSYIVMSEGWQIKKCVLNSVGPKSKNADMVDLTSMPQ